MNQLHGGDIYRNNVKYDFSVNTNPLGVSKAVKTALHQAVDQCQEYPDIMAEKLKKAVSEWLHVPQEYLLFGNGASELFAAIVHAFLPKKTMIPVPSFYGYEYAAKMARRQLVFYKMDSEHDFCLDDNFFKVLDDSEIALLFLANPNNPTGKLLETSYLKKLLCICQDKGIFVVLDECFIEFCSSGSSMLGELAEFENLIIVRAFTKSFALPGVRLGYLVCSNIVLLESLREQLPEWNISCFAQEAGYLCTKQTAYLEQTIDYVRKERSYLTEHLGKMDLKVFSSTANFIMVYSPKPLYEALLKYEILIRDCENFRGLTKGFYRIAVKTRAENEILVNTIERILT